MKITNQITLLGLLSLLLAFSCAGGDPRVDQFIDELDALATELVQAVEATDMIKAGQLTMRFFGLIQEVAEIEEEGIEITPSQEARIDQIAERVSSLIPGGM